MAIDIGTLQASIELNTGALNAAVPAFNRLEKVIDNLTSTILGLENTAKTAFDGIGRGVRKPAEDAEKTGKDFEQLARRINSSMEDARLKTDKFAFSMSRMSGGKAQIQAVEDAYSKLRAELAKATTTEQASNATKSFNRSLEKSSLEAKKASPEIGGLNVNMTQMAKTATVALGPLNGVASRITALTAIAKASAIPLAVLLGGFAGFAVLTGKAAIAGAKFESSMMLMDNALRAFNSQTGLTAAGLNAIAVELAEVTLTSTAFAREAAVALQAFSGIGNEAQRILYVAQDLSTTFGGSLLENTRKLGQVFENPIRALENLGEAGIRFSASEKRVIQSFVDTGKAANAADYILAKIEGRVGGNAKRAAEGLAGAWDTLGERITKFVETVGSVETRGGTLAATISEISDKLEKWSQQAGLAENLGQAVGGILKAIANTALFLAEHIRKLTFAVVAFAVFGLGKNMYTWLFIVNGQMLKNIITNGLFTIATQKATAATIAFRSALMATGFGAVIGLVSALAADYFVLGGSIDTTASAQDRLNQVNRTALEVEEEKRKKIVKRAQDTITAAQQQITQIVALTVALRTSGGQWTTEIERNERSLDFLGKVISDNTQSLAGLKKTQDNISKDTQTVHGFNQQRDALQSLIGNYVTGAEDAEKYGRALNIANTLPKSAIEAKAAAIRIATEEERKARLALKEAIGEENQRVAALRLANAEKDLAAAKTMEMTRTEKDFIRNIKALESFGGFKDVRDQIVDSNTAFEQATASLTALKEEGIVTEAALKKTFSNAKILEDYRRQFEFMATEKLQQHAINAMLVVDLNNEAELLQAVAEYYANLAIKTKDASEATTDLRNVQREVNGLMAEVSAVNNLSLFEKIAGFFDSSIIEKVKDFEGTVAKLALDLAEKEKATPGSLKNRVAEYEKLGKIAGMEDPFAGVDLGKADQVARRIEEIKRALKDTTGTQLADTINQIGQSFMSMISQMSNMYAEQASYHRQMAQEALSYAQNQSEFYMQLADAVHYSNNAQAQSFEQKAVAAAEAGAAQYAAEKEAQEKSNALAKKAFETQKRLQVASAIASTAVAVMKTFERGGIYAAPLATAMAALGAIQVATIQSQQFTPRESGGSIYGNKAYITSEGGPEIFMPGRSGTMISQKEIMEGLSGGGRSGEVNVNFTVVANDTTDFERLLMNNRGAIINMIKDATNQEMRDSPV